jgi:hypothetical protein
MIGAFLVLIVVGTLLLLIVEAVQWVVVKVTEAAQYLAADPLIAVGMGVLVGILHMGGIWFGVHQYRERTLYHRRVREYNRRLSRQQ